MAERPTRVTVYNKAALAELLTPAAGDEAMMTSASMFSDSRRRSTRSGPGRSSRRGPVASLQQQSSSTMRTAGRRSSVRSTSSLADALLNSVVAYDPSDSPTRARLRARHVERMKRQMAEIQDAVNATRKRKAMRREAKAAARESNLERGRGMEETVVNKVTTHLEERAQRRKEIYDKWVANVFEPVNEAVHKAVNSRTSVEIQKDRCREYQRYLDATNTRDLFTDIVSGDYDPYRLHKHRPKPRVPRLLDPLKRQIHSKMEEDALITSDTGKEAEREAQARSGSRARSRGAGGAGGTMRAVAGGGRPLARSQSAAAAVGRTTASLGGGGRTLGGSASMSQGLGRAGGARGIRGSQSAAVLRGAGREVPPATATSGGAGAVAGAGAGTDAGAPPRTAGGRLRPRLAQAPGFGVHRKNLLGRSGGKWTLPVTSWGSGKLEANSAACTVKTRLAGGLFDDTSQSLEEFCAEGKRTFKAARHKMLPDQFGQPTKIQQYNMWNRELPRPQKRTFAPWHHGNLLESVVPGQTHNDTDQDIKRIG